MIAKSDRDRKRTPKHTANRAALRDRTRELLSCEIGFIPHPDFREMDSKRLWRLELQQSADEPAGGHSQLPQPAGSRDMPPHLRQLCAVPLLSPAEERDLFRRMNYLKYRANATRATLNERQLSRRKLDEIELLLSKATAIRNRIVTANTRLVMSIVKKFADEANMFDELLSEGIGCLLKAVDKFDVNRGFRFSTYATMAVRREVYRWIHRVRRDRSRFATGNNDALQEQEESAAPIGQSEASRRRLTQKMAGLLGHLDPREQLIVRARFGFVDVGTKPTFSKLGEKLGVSKERVRQLEVRAIAKLRDLARESGLSEDDDLL